MWSSRQKLLIFNFSILFLLFLFKNFDYYEIKNRELDLEESEYLDERDLIRLVKSAKEEIDYLRATVLGTAEIDPVVEAKKELIEFRSCKKLKNIENVGSLNVWKKNGNWWLFSAFYDSRKNSLYPENDSIQVSMLVSIII